MKRRLLKILAIVILSLTIDTASSAQDDAMEQVHTINQRACGPPKKDYNFIREYKRLPEYRYVAAYKRFPDYLYSFGIGKRFDDSTKRISPYSFGVGKRNPLDKLTLRGYPESLERKNYDVDLLIDDPNQQAKRNAPWHAYGFGIGKRAAHIFNYRLDNHHDGLNNEIKLDDDQHLWNKN